MSPFEKAKEEVGLESKKMAWEKIGRMDLYLKDADLKVRENKIKEERNKLDEEMSLYKDSGRWGTPRVWDKALEEIRTTETSRAWAKLGKADLTAKEEDLLTQLAKLSDEEKPYNGNVCEMKRRIDRTYFERHAPSGYRSPLDEARWQAKELLYPQETELWEAKRKAEQDIILAGVPEKVEGIMRELRHQFEKIMAHK